MATRLTIARGRAATVYDDRWRPLVEALGPLSITRASEVEYDPASGDWIATHLPSGAPIARGPHRGDVIAAEVAWLEAHSPGAEGPKQAAPDKTH